MAFQEFCEVHKSRTSSKCVPIPTTEPASIEEIGTDNFNSAADERDDLLDNETTKSKDNPEEFSELNNKNNQDDDEHEGYYVESRRTKKGSVYPNEGDGATYKHYKWTQTPTELEILVPLCQHRQEHRSTLKVNYTPSSVFAYIQDNKMFGGSLADRIKTDEVTWTLEDNVLCIRAEKVKTSWWKQLLVTEPMLLLKPILRKHAAMSDISEEEMKQFQQTVVNKRDYTIAKHKEQFPDKIPLPDHLKEDAA